MDKDQAKFILSSFRPDGADATDADFADALQLAAEDRELGEWLADERSADATFAAMLNEVEIPEALRQHILSVMRSEQPVDPEQDQAMDDILFDAIGDVQPPAGLREEILAAMEMQVQQAAEEVSEADNIIRPSAGKVSWFTGWKRLMAVAAALVLGAFVAIQVTVPNTADGQISSYEVQKHAGDLLNTNFDLDVKGSDAEDINTWLVSHELPTPSSLPEHLNLSNSLGCKEIELPGGIKAALICFSGVGENSVHLIVVKNEFVEDRNLPSSGQVTAKDCYHCPATEWNVVRWQDEQNTFVLLSKKSARQKDDLMQYF